MTTLHHLNAERDTLHGHFSRDLAPVLTIDSGDSVRFQCLDLGWGSNPHNGIDIHRREVERRNPELDNGHALTCPVFIRGAKPGMTLAVHIQAIEVGQWGTTMAGGWPNPWNEKLGVTTEGRFHLWTFNHEANTARNQYGHMVTICPFMGCIWDAAR